MADAYGFINEYEMKTRLNEYKFLILALVYMCCHLFTGVLNKMIWIFLVGILFVCIYLFFIKPLNYWTDHGVKQSNPVPFFGDNFGTVFRTRSFAQMFYQFYNMYPQNRYMGFYQFTVPNLMIRDPDLIKQIAVKDFDHFTDHRSFIDPEVDPLWGKNLFALRGQPWRDMRATLSGSFTSSKLRHLFGLIKDTTDNFVQHFLEKDEKIIEVEMKNIFSRYTNDVIATTAFGVKVNSLEHQNNAFYLMGKDATDFTSLWKVLKLFGFLTFPKLFKYLNIKFFTNNTRDFFNKLIGDTIKVREEQGIVRPDMINLLLEARRGNQKNVQEEIDVIDNGFAVAKESEIGNSIKLHKQNITDADITSQAMIFFFAGFDTLSNVMCLLAYELAVNQDIQKKLRAEIMKTTEDCNRSVSYEAILKMKYLDMIVTETLRKWPTVVAMDRVCTKPYTIEPTSPGEQPIKLKIGDVLWFPCYPIHRDPEYYPDPDKFDPERFSEENKDSVNPYTYIPFGVGPRNCIGSRFALLEIKTVFFYLLSKFDIVPTIKSEIPIKISKKSFNIIAENGFWFGLKRI